MFFLVQLEENFLKFHCFFTQKALFQIKFQNRIKNI